MHFQIICKFLNAGPSRFFVLFCLFLFTLSKSIQWLDVTAVSFWEFCQVFSIVRVLDEVQRKMLVFVSLQNFRGSV